jgi:hypothetical protein
VKKIENLQRLGQDARIILNRQKKRSRSRAKKTLNAHEGNNNNNAIGGTISGLKKSESLQNFHHPKSGRAHKT